MTTSNTFRLAFAGTRADRARVSITAFGAAAAVFFLLCTVTVMAVVPESGRYTNRMLTDSAILENVYSLMILFTVPIMFFVGQCARLGAPSRDRRLAAFRVAGASPEQVVRIAAAETGVAVLIGTALGAVAYFTGRILLDSPRPDGTRPLPTDVLPSPFAVFIILIGVPVLATLLTVVLLRRVAITPFDVVRRSERRRVRAWPGLLGVVGLLGLMALDPLSRSDIVRSGRLGAAEFPLALLWVLTCTVLLMLGLMLSTTWIGHLGARLLLRLTRRPSALIAARQTLADPYEGSRTYSVIQVTTAFFGAAMMVKSYMFTKVVASTASEQERARLHGDTPSDYTSTVAFHTEVFELLNMVMLALIGVAALTLLVALVETGVARRRTLAALVATGTPRAVLARALCWRVLIPAIPGIAAASLAGMFAMRSFTDTVRTGYQTGRCVGTAEQCSGHPALHPEYWVKTEEAVVVMQVPLPWADVAGVGLTALASILVVIAASVLLQRSNLNPTELRAE